MDELTDTHDQQGNGEDDNHNVVIPYDIASVDLRRRFSPVLRNLGLTYNQAVANPCRECVESIVSYSVPSLQIPKVGSGTNFLR
jgi:hypothetical protein